MQGAAGVLMRKFRTLWLCVERLPDSSFKIDLEDESGCLRKRPGKAWGREEDTQEDWGHG